MAVVGAVCALLCAAAPASGQARAELAARIDSLDRVALSQRARLAQLDSMAEARRRAIVMDTTRIGPFLLVDPDTADNARAAEAIAAVWSQYSAVAGEGAARIAGATVTSSPPQSFGTLAQAYSFNPGIWGGLDRERAAHVVVRSALTDALPSDVRDWLLGARVTLRPDNTQAYRELATAHSHSARACYDGDTAACIVTLGLVDPGADWERWYTPDELRAQVAQRVRPMDAAYACANDGDHEACLQALRALHGALPPVGGGARAGLLAHALGEGGPGSFERLFAPAPDVGSRIAHAAGTSLDVVIDGWRARLDEARPDMRAGVIDAGVWTVVWLAALALLATRSTRWRIG